MGRIEGWILYDVYYTAQCWFGQEICAVREKWRQKTGGAGNGAARMYDG